MPHDKAHLSGISDSSGVAVDHRRALTLTPVSLGKLNNCQIGNPLKIPRRRNLAEEYEDVPKSAKKPNKIHWTQLAGNDSPPQQAFRQNGKKANDDDSMKKMDIMRRQVKVILTDVLQTEVGRKYLSNCGRASMLIIQSEPKREARLSADHADGQRACAACKDQTKSLPLTPTNSSTLKRTSAANTEARDTHLCKEMKPSPTKRLKIVKALKQTTPASSAEKDSCSPKETDCSPCKQSQKLLSNQTRSPNSLSGSPLHSEGTDSEISESNITATQKRTPLRVKRSERLNGKEYHSTECKATPPEHSESEICAEEMRDEKEDSDREKDETQQQNGEALEDADPGARCSVLRLSEVAAEDCSELELSDPEVQSSPDELALDSEHAEVRKACKSDTPEPIVLSSEEEEGDDSGTSHLRTPEGAKDPFRQPKASPAVNRKKMFDMNAHPLEMHSQCPVMELQFSALYMGGLSAVTSGLVKIADDSVTISLKDTSGAEPETQPAEGSVCVLLCVCEPLNGVQGALLASIMDIVGIRHNNSALLSPLPHDDALKILQDGQDTHLLQLLQPRADTQTVAQESRSSPAPAGAASSTAKAQESDTHADSVYTLCHSKTQGNYIVSLARKPTADWSPYQHCGPARRLIQFPPPPSKGAITVTTEDLECLDSGEFLNDVIIDFYLKYLFVQKAPRASVKRSHVFSSFFYKQLTRRDNANEDISSTPQFRRHQRVRTWTRHVDIFEKDFLFVPVNQEAHWYMVVICFPGLEEPQYVERKDQEKKVHDGTENSSNSTAHSESQQGDGEKNPDERTSSGPPTCTVKTCKQQTICKRPCILIMDSLKLSVHERILKLLREYLQVEWEVKRGGFRDFSAERMVGSHCKVPLQDNSSDCGLYLLQYAESFLQDPVVHFDLPLRLENWFPRQKVREKRQEIRDLILYLYRFQQDSLRNEVSQHSTETENIVE
ncbi:sentrin-specific protease 7 isoform X2 [Trichomycterus rosablanca]|uniref:sentrin-specific protease 7 isoform X2 n=1 Tax=Trichomycterus rosablanca TaxID=2290929 RepID=UPI002F35C664